MTSKQVDQFEIHVIEVLGKSPEFPQSLVDRLVKEFSMQDADVRDGIWRMIDRGTIRLNRERKMEATPTEQSTSVA